jgi:hypothetical protein
MNPLVAFLIPKLKIDLSDETSQQVRGIKLICVNIAREAFAHYLNRNLVQFNPLVGDTACQIRAAMLQEMIQKGEVGKNKLLISIEKLEKLRQQLLTSASLSDDKELLFDLTEQEKFLMLSHLLTCIRDPASNYLENRATLLNAFSDHVFVEEKHLLEISLHAKRLLSDRSVKYVRNLKNPEDLLLKKMLIQEEDANSNGIKCVAFYFALKSLFEKLKKNQSCICLNIDKNKLIFQFDGNGSLQKIEDPKRVLNQPAFVVSCKSNQESESLPLIKSLEGDRVTQFILAAAAEHPQFAGKRKKVKIDIFEHAQIKPHLVTCGGDSLTDIQEKIKQKLKAKELRIANSACRPANLEQVIFAHSEYNRLKDEGEQNKRIIEIQHIFCNTVQDELDGRK